MPESQQGEICNDRASLRESYDVHDAGEKFFVLFAAFLADAKRGWKKGHYYGLMPISRDQKETDSFKDSRRARDGVLLCAVCGWAPPSIIRSDVIQAHHVIPNACGGSNAYANQILLCPTHHVLAHRMGKMGQYDSRPNSYREWFGAHSPSELLDEFTLLDRDPEEWRVWAAFRRYPP